MENINFETTQNVLLEHEVANIGERILAQLIDFVILFVYFLIVITIIIAIAKFTKGDTVWVLFLILEIPAMLYSLLCEIFFHGQTLGKYIMKLKVVKIDGTQPGILNYFVRWIMRIVDIWIFSGAVALVTIIANGKGQRLGDIAAGTTLIKLKKKVYFKDSVYRFLPENYQIVFSEAKLLNDNDINIINEVLKAHSKFPNNSSSQLIKETVIEIITKTNIQTNMHPGLFLETLIRDYNFIYKEHDA
jgi:uncharacterized RDD family membrane protein YckC